MYGIVLVMSSFARGILSVRYQVVYYFARLCGKSSDDATVSARCILTHAITKAINTRTQSLARRICTTY